MYLKSRKTSSEDNGKKMFILFNCSFLYVRIVLGKVLFVSTNFNKNKKLLHSAFKKEASSLDQSKMTEDDKP